MTDDTVSPLAIKSHVKFFKRFLNYLPSNLSNYDSTRLTIAFFAISGLEILNALEDLDNDYKKNICNWIYRLQVLPTEDGDMKKCGFQGSDTLIMNSELGHAYCNSNYVTSHLAMTYTGLASLVILGDDLSRVNKTAVISGVRALQQEDGSFCATLPGSENDMRFVYCAACVCYIMQDWSGMNVEKTVSFIKKCMSYDYGLGQGPELESHGGVTYCGVAALTLMGKLSEALSTKQMLDFFHLVNFAENRRYVMTTQDALTGGFSKWPDSYPDPIHTYLGLCGLSLMGEDGLQEISPALNISQRAIQRLHDLHLLWKLPDNNLCASFQEASIH